MQKATLKYNTFLPDPERVQMLKVKLGFLLKAEHRNTHFTTVSRGVLFFSSSLYFSLSLLLLSLYLFSICFYFSLSSIFSSSPSPYLVVYLI